MIESNESLSNSSAATSGSGSSVSDRSSSTSLSFRPLGSRIRRTLDSVRAQLHRYVLIYACLIAACWVLFFFWFGGFIDFVPVTMGSSETPRWLRIGLLILMAAGPLWAFLVWAAPRWMTPLKDRSIALLIERHFPSLNNQLLTAVELSQPSEMEIESGLESSNPVAHQKMLDRVHEQLDSTIGVVNPSRLFDWRPVLAASFSVAVAVFVTLAALLVMPTWMSHWSKRLFTLSDAPWPRNAELRADGVMVPLPAFRGQLAADRQLVRFEDGSAKVPQGSAVLLQISAATEDKLVPEVCTVFYRTEDGSRGRANMRRIGAPREAWQPFVLDGPPLDGIAQSIEFDVLGLDARLSDLQIQVVDPAIITSLNLELAYPKYLLSSLTRAEVETVPYRTGMRIPQGTQVRVRGKASAPLSQVDYVLSGGARQTEASANSGGGANSESSSGTEPPTEQNSDAAAVASIGSQDRLQIETVPATGDEFEIDLGVVDSSQVIEIRGLDENGLSSEQIPRYVLSMQEDTIPEVATRLKGIGSAITPEALIPIEGTVSDDNGIAELWVELAGSDGTETKVDLVLPDEEELVANVDLQTLREQKGFQVAPGDTLGFVVVAQDYFDLDADPHRGRGQAKQLSVVTADELLVLLDRQELELRQRLEIIMDELQQLGETLDSLSVTPGQSALYSPPVLPTGLEGLTIPPAALFPQPLGLSAASILQSGTNDDAARRQRMLAVRAQQSVLQGDKSQQELVGVAVSVEDLRLQLQNNRIDSYDRQARLQEKVHTPLVAMLADEFEQFSGLLLELQTASMSGECSEQALNAHAGLDAVLRELESIKENMLDIESFNEIIDLVRGLLEDQEELLDATERKKQQSILDLLKQ